MSLALARTCWQSHRAVATVRRTILDPNDQVNPEAQAIASQVVHIARAAAGDGIKHKQPSVTVGAVRELDALLGLGINSNRGNRHGWRR